MRLLGLFSWQGETLRVHVDPDGYGPGRIAVTLDFATGERYARLSVNVPEMLLGPREFLAKTYSENADIAPALLASGLFIDSCIDIEAGHTTLAIWRLA